MISSSVQIRRKARRSIRFTDVYKRQVLGTKEALLLIRAVEDGMRVTSLYFEDEIVTAPAKTASKLTKAEVTMAKQLIDQLSGPFDIADYHDEYQERLRNLIERKIHGQEIVKVKEKQSVQAVDVYKRQGCTDRAFAGGRLVRYADPQRTRDFGRAGTG